MRKSMVAALLSALVLPGAGHLYLKRFGRGLVLIGLSLAGLWIVIGDLMQQASAVLEKVEEQGGMVDATQIADLAAQTSGGSGSALSTLALLVLLICWLFGIVDAWRLGRIGEQQK